MNALEFDPIQHVYSIQGRAIPGVTSILKEAGLCYYPPNADDARLLGKNVHEAIHLLDTPEEGELDPSTMDPAWLPYLEQYTRFKEQTGFQVTHSEIPLYEDVLLFAGTEDKIGTINGVLSLVDIKTGSPAKWHICQLAAYKHLAIRAKIPVQKCFNLYLTPTTYKLREASYQDLARGWDAFCAALTIYQFKGGNHGNHDGNSRY